MSSLRKRVVSLQQKNDLDREFIDRIFQARVPYSGSLELTHRCNLACRHCYQFPPRDGELDTGAWKDILRQLAQCGCLFISFTGGEPLLREDLLELISWAAELDFVVTLQSNATLLREEHVRYLAEIPNFRADVSLYGDNPATHDGFTGVVGSFASTMRALEMMLQEDIPVLLKVTVGDFNFREMEGIAALAGSMGVKAVFSSFIFPRNDRDTAPTALRLDDARLREFFRFETAYMLDQLGEMLGVEGASLTHEDLVRHLSRCAVGPIEAESKRRRYCGGGSTVFAVNPYGEVYPCVAFPLVVGSLREEDFASLWKNSPQLENLRAREGILPTPCRECNLLESCALCMALSYLEGGENMYFSEERCRQTRILSSTIEALRDG